MAVWVHLRVRRGDDDSGERGKRVDKGSSRTRDLCNSAVAETDASHGAENTTMIASY